MRAPEQQLRDVPAAVNKDAPAMVDSETRLDRAEAGPSVALQYDHTLINVSTNGIDKGETSGGRKFLH
jgi:hypothetical protein